MNQQAAGCYSYLLIEVIVTVVQIVMTEPPLVLNMDMMVKLVGLGLLQLHKHTVTVSVTFRAKKRSSEP